MRLPRFVLVLSMVVVVAGTGCYYQQPLPRDPSYRPASWEPVLGVVTTEGDEVMFDEPALLESGRVVGRVDGDRVVVQPLEVSRLIVGRKSLDKPRTILFGGALIAAFIAFFASIGID